VSASVATVLVARGVIAGVLLAAAAVKWRDHQGAVAVFRAARVPESLARTLPVVEGFTALGLLIEQHTAWAAYVACALLVAFTLFVAVRVVQGDDAPCPCFGATSAAPMGGRTLARDIALVAVAVIGTGRATTDHWLSLIVAVIVAVGIASRWPRAEDVDRSAPGTGTRP
jgi:hypothetical protein